MDRGLLCWIDDERPPGFGKAQRSKFEERVYHNFTILVCSQIMAVGVWLTLCRLEHGRSLGKKQNSRHRLPVSRQFKGQLARPLSIAFDAIALKAQRVVLIGPDDPSVLEASLPAATSLAKLAEFNDLAQRRARHRPTPSMSTLVTRTTL